MTTTLAQAKLLAPDIVGASVFGTWSRSPLSLAIRWVTGGYPSHLGIVFHRASVGHGLPVNPGDVYMEAMMGRDVQPPRSCADLIHWWVTKPHRRLAFRALHLDRAGTDMLYQDCLYSVGHVAYSRWQLLQHWFFERIGRRVGIPIPRSPQKVTCSEWVSRELGRVGIDLRDEIRTRHDEVTPHSAWMVLSHPKTPSTINDQPSTSPIPEATS